MSSLGYDTLSDFKIDLSVDPIQPLQSIKPYQGGSVTISGEERFTPTPEMEANAATTQQQAQTSVNTEAYMNMMANQYAGQYLPVREKRREYGQQYYKALGLGNRYNPADFEAEIRQSLGELPKKSGLDKTLNFVIDALNGRTPFKGVSGALDILSQATGKALGRAEQDTLNRLNYQMKVGELAVQQAQSANKIIMEKEADFYLKMMGYDNEDMTNNMNFNKDILKQVSQHNLDFQKDRMKASVDLLNNVDKPLYGVYTDETGTKQTGTVRVMPSEFGPQLMLGRVQELEDGRRIQIFDVPLPAGPDGTLDFATIGGQQPGTETEIFNAMAGSPAKIKEGVQEFASLDGTLSDISNILLTAQSDINKLGLPGSIQSFLQTTGQNIESIFNEISKNSGGSGFAGSSLTNFGEMAYNRDRLEFGDFDEKEPEILLTDLPKGPNPFAKTTKNISASMEDIFTEEWFTAAGYDTSYAENKVRENFIIYGLARANKPTGRLNVDDIKRASDAVSIYGAKAPRDVIAALKEVDRKIRQAQGGLLRSYPEIITQDPSFRDRAKAEEKLRGLGLNPANFEEFFYKATGVEKSNDANEIQSQQPEIQQERTVPNEFDNEGEAVTVDDLFSVSSIGGMM